MLRQAQQGVRALLRMPQLTCSTSAQIVASLQGALEADAASGDMAAAARLAAAGARLAVVAAGGQVRSGGASNDPSFASHSHVVDTVCDSDHVTNSVAPRHPWAFSKLFSDQQPTSASFMDRIELHAGCMCIAQCMPREERRVLRQPPPQAQHPSDRGSQPPTAPRRSQILPVHLRSLALWRTRSDEGGGGAAMPPMVPTTGMAPSTSSRTWFGRRLSTLPKLSKLVRQTTQSLPVHLRVRAKLPGKIERLSNSMIGL